MTLIEKGRGDLEAAVDLNADLRARRLDRRELETETHELEMARRRRLILEEQVAMRRLEERLVKDEPTPAAEPGKSNDDPLAEYLRTEAEVRRTRSRATHIADAIRATAAAERRDLTSEERELLDMYESAAAAAEGDIRRGGAADF
jgi:hypothetical protein